MTLGGDREPGSLPPLLESLQQILAGREQRTPKPGPGRRAASVMAPFFVRDGTLNLLMIRRTDRVRTHKGQVAFPGGAEDPEDQTPLDTALREAHEEVGIDPASVTVIGALRPFDTRVSDFVVHPFVAYLAEPNPVFTPQSFEVDEVLEVPVASLRDREARHWGLVPGFNVPIPLPYYRIGETIVWGATGGIVGELLEALDEADAARA